LQFIGLAAVYVVSSWTGVCAPDAPCLHILPSNQSESAF